MDVADFLHLEAAFHADSIVDAAADEEDILCVAELRGEPLEPLLVVDDALYLFGQGRDLGEQTLLFAFVNQAARFAEADGEQVDTDQLGRVSLGRRNRNLRSRIGVEHKVRLAGNDGADHIDNREGLQALLFGLAHRRERIRGFTRLADYDDQVVRVDNRVAVAVFRGELNADRELCEILYHILRRSANMVSRAAADNRDAA